MTIMKRMILSSGRAVLTKEYENEFFVVWGRAVSGPFKTNDKRFSAPEPR